MREPLQMFHLNGYFFLAGGLGLLIHGALHGSLNPDGVAFLALGAGVVVGVHACTLVYKRKMAATDRLPTE